MMTITAVNKLGRGAAVAALGVVLAACGSSSSSGGTGSGTGSTTTVSGVAAGSGGSGASGLNTRSTSIGTVLVDSQGHTVYELAGNPASNSMCTSSCEAFWPPVTSGGKLLVIKGHPVFAFAEDSGAGQTHGQAVKDTWGTWYALNASGSPIAAGSKGSKPTKPASSPTSSSTSGSGGYGY